MQGTLSRHPSTACEFVVSFDAFVTVRPDHMLSIRYVVAGDVDRILEPAPEPARRVDRLWENTCFELFVRTPNTRRYREFDFSPSTCWAAYAFDDYRTGMTDLPLRSAPRIACRRGVGTLELDVLVCLGELDARDQNGLRIGLAAVIEDRQGGKSYWALAHPNDAPDFHRADACTLELARAVLEP